MEKEPLIECEYCGSPISIYDHRCPNCSADCSHIIKKFKKEREAKKEEEKKIKQEENLKVQKHYQKYYIFVAVLVISLFLIATFSIVTAFTRAASSQSEEFEELLEGVTTNKSEMVEVGFNELAETKYYTIILDSYELYSYSSVHFPSHYNTPDGYQKIAFHFILNNTSSSEVSTYSSFNTGAQVTLKADDYVVDDAELSAGSQEYVVSGQTKYPEFNINTVNGGDKLQGYVGFLVPKSAKQLKFNVGKNVTIVMDNPAYEG